LEVLIGPAVAAAVMVLLVLRVVLLFVMRVEAAMIYWESQMAIRWALLGESHLRWDQ
jgi:hypothetical protein